MNDRFHVGDEVHWGRERGIVVGVIERGEYSEAQRQRRWSGLGRGVLVETADGQIVHIRDAATVLR